MGSLLSWHQGMVYRCPIGDGGGREIHLRRSPGHISCFPPTHVHECTGGRGGGTRCSCQDRPHRKARSSATKSNYPEPWAERSHVHRGAGVPCWSQSLPPAAGLCGVSCNSKSAAYNTTAEQLYKTLKSAILNEALFNCKETSLKNENSITSAENSEFKAACHKAPLPLQAQHSWLCTEG